MKEPEQLGPYKIVRLLGRGGMGSVYEGIDETHGQRVAIKVLAAQMAAEAGFRDRFEAEIETLKTLNHPNIVRLHAFGEQNELLYYAMELVEGRNLEDELQAGRQFDWREATQIGIQICKALKHAHDHGVIHRDIKPANLLLDENNDVKLTDFGIARLFGNVGMTVDGGIMGTAEYMAPEQADGRPVTHHCDLYSLGGVLYALLSGRAPFHSTSLPELLHMQRYSEPDPVRRHAVDTPAELEQVVDQLLAKDPKDRYPNAAVVARKLEELRNRLSLRDEDAEKEFHLAEPGTATNRASHDPDASTMAPEDVVRSATPAPSSGETAIYTAPGEAGSGESPEGVSPALDHFTRVKEGLQATPDDDRESVWSSPQTWILSLAIVLLILGAWYLKPRSANALYSQIVSVAGAAETDASISTADLEDATEEFLRRFPADERAAEIRQIQDRLAQEARDDGKNPLPPEGKHVSPIEYAYRDAVRQADAHPERAIAQLKSLVDLYGDAAETDDDRRAIERANEAIKELESATAERRAATVELVRQRLDAAKKIAAENPQRARRIYQAVVDLYGSKDWAKSLVDTARDALKNDPPSATADSRDTPPADG